MSKREENLDVLRVIATFMVILLHVSASYVTGNINNPNTYFTIGNFFDSFTRVCVPIFVMLSGAFLLDNAENQRYKQFYIKTFKNIVIPTLIWSIIYFVYSIVVLMVQDTMGAPIQMREYIRPLLAWIKGEPFYHLWYMYMIIGLYLATPILIRLKDRIGESKTFKFSIVLLVIGMVIDTKMELIWPIQFIEYLGYFIIGYSLRTYYKQKNKGSLKFVIGFIISAILVFGVTEFMVRGEMILDNRLYFYGYLSPIVGGGAICLFTAFINMKDIRIGARRLAQNSFNIYLIHAGILSLIELLVIDNLQNRPNPIWYIPVMTIMIFVGSHLIIEGINALKYRKHISELQQE